MLRAGRTTSAYRREALGAGDMRGALPLCFKLKSIMKLQKPFTIFTIGYEGIDIDTFIAMLTDNGVETVVDVRELPLSRKAGFSKKALAAQLSLSGFDYLHVGKLGCPRSIRNAYREDSNWKRYTIGFIEYLQTQGEPISSLTKLASESNCALLCFEADANFCHRSMVAKEVASHSGATVNHLKISTKKAKPVVSARSPFFAAGIPN
jgi:uncharacterized protein (DUF488 family)